MVSELIQEVIDFAKPQYEKRNHHKWAHIEDVLSRAKLIGKEIELDWEILTVAIILHDINYDNYSTHVDESVKIAEKYLNSINYSKNKIKKVIEIMFDHSRPHRLIKGEAESNEGKIMYDADKTSFMYNKIAYEKYVDTLYLKQSKEMAKKQIN